jgi:hypothetical protein
MTIQLPPEIEAGLRAEAAALGVPVTEVVAKAVGAYLRESGTRKHVRRAPYEDRHAEMAWAARPDPRFVGKWVVLEGGQVIVSGANAKQTYEEARGHGISSPFLIYVSGEEHEPFAGGWLD